MDKFDWEWAFSNIARDQKDHIDEVKTVIDALKPWMNLPLYQQEIKTKRSEQETQVSPSFLDDLRKRGVPEEDLLKMANDNIPQDAETSSTIDNEDIDPPPRIING